MSTTSRSEREHAESGKSDLSKLAASLGDQTAFDRVSMAFIDGINVVPIVGPIIAAVARQVLPQDALLYLQLFAVESARRVEKLDEAKLDRAYLAGDEFREDLEQIFDAQTLLVQRRKRRYYLAAVSNSAAKDRPGEHERRRMIDLLIRLRPSHLRLLAAVVSAQAYQGPVDDATGYLQARLPGVSEEVIRLDWADLAAEGVLEGYPSGMHIAPPLAYIATRLKPFGRSFATFIEAGDLGT